MMRFFKLHFNIIGCVMTSVKLAWKYNIFKHSMGEWRNRKLMLVWISHVTLWLSVTLVEIRRFYYWSKYSVWVSVCVSSHKFPVYDTVSSSEIAKAECFNGCVRTPLTQHFTLSFYPCSPASSLKCTFSMCIQSFIHTAGPSQGENPKQHTRDCWVHWPGTNCCQCVLERGKEAEEGNSRVTQAVGFPFTRLLPSHSD